MQWIITCAVEGQLDNTALGSATMVTPEVAQIDLEKVGRIHSIGSVRNEGISNNRYSCCSTFIGCGEMRWRTSATSFL